MHFHVKNSDLLSAVSLLEKAIATSDTVPVLQTIQLTAKEDQLVLIANNLQIAIQTKILCKTLVAGEKLVNGKLFCELIRKLPAGDIIVKGQDHQVTVSIETMDFTLNTITSDEYPDFPDCQHKALVLTDCELQQLIKNSSFAASTDDHQPIFSGILIEILEQEYQFVASDSNRLSFVYTKNGEIITADQQFIVPKQNLLELSRCLPLTETPVEIYSGDNQLAFHFDDTIFTTRLIDGKFPNYRSVLFTEQKTSFVMKRLTFIQAIERAYLFSRADKTPILMQLTDGLLEIGALSSLGQSSEQYNVEQSGNNEQAAFSPKFILDMLKTMEVDQVEFRFEGNRQALIKPTETDEHLYVLMPIRI